MLKIITGEAKGKILRTLEGEATRPTSSRVKEALFSSIQFDIDSRRVLDIFAGSGGLGLEAMSRGAKSVMFVDSAREAIDIVKENAKACGYFDRCRYLVSDYRNYIRKTLGREKFDLVFIDPPYSMECAADTALRLAGGGLLEDGAIVAIEGGSEEVNLSAFSDFDVVKHTYYGKKTFLLVLLYHTSK